MSFRKRTLSRAISRPNADRALKRILDELVVLVDNGPDPLPPSSVAPAVMNEEADALDAAVVGINAVRRLYGLPKITLLRDIR